MQQRQAQTVDGGFGLHHHARVGVGTGLGVDAVQVEANARTLEQLSFFLELEAVAQAAIDVAGQHGGIRQHLAGGANPVGDGGDRIGIQFELDVGFRFRVGGVLRHRRRVVGEAGFADVLDGVGTGAPPAQQVADEQALLRRLDRLNPGYQD
ncbi:hypothetical protein D9M69_632190 [compost metagenome]